MAEATTNAQPPPTSFSRWIPSLPTILNPFASDTAKSGEQTNTAGDADDNVRPLSKQPTALSTTSYHDSAHSGPPSPSRSSFFAEPSPSSNSDRGSPEGSVDGKRSKKTRPKTNYSVCHPPPESSKVRQKLHRRPRSLLQLHRLSDRSRPLPAYDVIPSANFSMRMHSAVGKVFRSRHVLCPNDLVVLQAEKYSSASDDEIDQEQARNVVGMICKGARGSNKDKDKDDSKKGHRILMAASGQEWEPKVLPNGSYEFFSPDSHGLGQTVRWVPKRNKDGTTVSRDGSKRFNFSTISPNTRRHPVIASLSKTAVDINDTYRLPDQASGTPMGSPRKGLSPLALDDDEDGNDPSNQQIYTPDQTLRDLITITAIWVTFKEGWSTNVKFDDDASKLPGSAPPSAPGSPAKPFQNGSHGHVPSLSSLHSTPSSPQIGAASTDRGRTNSMKAFSSDLIRRTSLLSKKRNSHTASASEIGSDDGLAERNASVISSPGASTAAVGRSRADSSSTVLVHRAASNRRRKNQLKESFAAGGDGQGGAAGSALEEVSAKREAEGDNDGGKSSRRRRRESKKAGLGIEDESSDSEEEDDDDDGHEDEGREGKDAGDDGKVSSSGEQSRRGESVATMETAAATRVNGSVGQTASGQESGKKTRKGKTTEERAVMRDRQLEEEGKKKTKGGWRRLFCGVAK